MRIGIFRLIMISVLAIASANAQDLPPIGQPTGGQPVPVEDIAPIPKDKFIISVYGGGIWPTQYDNPYSNTNLDLGGSLGHEFSSGFKLELNAFWAKMEIFSPVNPFINTSLPQTSLVSGTEAHHFITVHPGLRFTYRGIDFLKPGFSASTGFTTTYATGGTFTDVDYNFSFGFGGHFYLELADLFSIGPEVRYFGIYANDLTDIAAGGLLSSIYSHYILTNIVINLQF